MLLKFFKSDRPLVLITIPVLIFLLWMPEFMQNQVALFHFDNYSSPLYFYFQSIHIKYPLISKISGLALVLLLAFMLARLNSKYFFISIRTQMPALVYLMLVSSIPSLSRLSPMILSSVFFIFALDKLMGSFKQEGIAYKYFDAALIISISAMIYFPFIFIILILWIALIILRTFNWREWMFTFIGVLLPFLFLFTYYYWTDEGFISGVTKLFSILEVRKYEINFSAGYKLFTGFILLLILLASFNILKSYDTRKIQIRKYYLLFLFVFIISVLLYIITPVIGVEIIYIVAIPVSFLLSHYFVVIKTNFINNLIFGLFILAVIALRYYSTVAPLF